MGKLYIVATPIGNLEDITLRALRILKEVDYIACEDTRVTSKLLAHFDIKKPLLSFHAHSGQLKTDKIVQFLEDEKSIALLTDAGTPGISDPGGVLVSEAYEKDIDVVAIPGPSSVVTALSISGFPADEFLFLGFFPRKKGRKTLLESLVKDKRTIVFFESPHRIEKTLEMLKESMPDRDIFIARELTKKFEEIYRGQISSIAAIKARGEFVLVIRGAK